LPYVAPEVLTEMYRAQAADLWSCGIILVTMLTGGEFRITFVCLENYGFVLCFVFELIFNHFCWVFGILAVDCIKNI